MRENQNYTVVNLVGYLYRATDYPDRKDNINRLIKEAVTARPEILAERTPEGADLFGEAVKEANLDIIKFLFENYRSHLNLTQEVLEGDGTDILQALASISSNPQKPEAKEAFMYLAPLLWNDPEVGEFFRTHQSGRDQNYLSRYLAEGSDVELLKFAHANLPGMEHLFLQRDGIGLLPIAHAGNDKNFVWLMNLSKKLNARIVEPDELLTRDERLAFIYGVGENRIALIKEVLNYDSALVNRIFNGQRMVDWALNEGAFEAALIVMKNGCLPTYDTLAILESNREKFEKPAVDDPLGRSQYEVLRSEFSRVLSVSNQVNGPSTDPAYPNVMQAVEDNQQLKDYYGALKTKITANLHAALVTTSGKGFVEMEASTTAKVAATGSRAVGAVANVVPVLGSAVSAAAEGAATAVEMISRNVRQKEAEAVVGLFGSISQEDFTKWMSFKVIKDLAGRPEVTPLAPGELEAQAREDANRIFDCLSQCAEDGLQFSQPSKMADFIFARNNETLASRFKAANVGQIREPVKGQATEPFTASTRTSSHSSELFSPQATPVAGKKSNREVGGSGCCSIS